MITISPAVLGFLRALGVLILFTVLSYVGKADNLTFLSPAVAGLVSMLALGIEHAIEAKTGAPLLGLVKKA